MQQCARLRLPRPAPTGKLAAKPILRTDSVLTDRRGSRRHWLVGASALLLNACAGPQPATDPAPAGPVPTTKDALPALPDPPPPSSTIPARASGGRGGRAGTFADELIQIATRRRSYRLVVPPTAASGQPVPLVFAFHGLFDSKSQMPVYSKLDELATTAGFVLVYPQAREKGWPLVVEWAREDILFFDTLLAKLTAEYNIDLNRVHLVGMGNGGYFVHLLASLRPESIASIAVHSGGLGPLGFTEVSVASKYAAIIIHGNTDDTVPALEGRKARDAYRRWGHEVEYVELPRHGHAWASGFNINARIWNFLSSHPRRGEVTLAPVK